VGTFLTRRASWAIPPLICLALYWYGLTCWFRQDDFAWLGLSATVHNWRDFWRAMFMPLAMLMRTMPLVGFAPIIYIIFGDGALCVAIIGLIIVFFPVLINMTAGLRSAPTQSMDVVSVYGGGRWTAVRMVALPTALPNFFAALKIAVPGSLVGAMLYEWLFSLKGLGGEINVANANALYSETWAIVVLVTGVSILLYNLVVLVEAPVLARWGPDAGRHLVKE